MKILLTAIGTRGDIEPFLTLGKLLVERGCQVHYQMPQQLCHLTDEEAKVYPMTRRFLDLIDSPAARLVMGRGSKWAKTKAMWQLYRQGLDINKQLLQEQEQVVQEVNPDLIVFHSKCFYPLLWHLSTRRRIVLLTPVPFLIHDVDGYPHVGFTKSMGTVINRWTYRLIRTAIAYSIKKSQKSVAMPHAHGLSEIKRLLRSMPAAFAVSPTIVRRPDHWPTNAQVVGYHHRPSATNWRADDQITAFLARHERVLFLTFGSMVNDDPLAISKRLYSVLQQLRIPTIVNCADGGLVKIDTYAENDSFYFVQGLPYDWLLPQVHAIVCHGGAGTTHQALLHGLPTMIVPHIMDQHVWAQLVHNLGIGTRGLPVTKVGSDSLVSQLRDLWTNKTYQLVGSTVKRQMDGEVSVDDYLNFVLASTPIPTADDK